MLLVLQDFKEKLNLYFGLGSIGILFLGAFLFLLLRKENGQKLKLYVTYLVVSLALMLNPISLYVVDQSGNMEVYERLFWVLMTPLTIAVAFVFVTERRNFLLVPALILILLCGRSVFTTTEYKPAENSLKINQTAIDVSDMIMRDFEGLPKDAKIVPNRGLTKMPRALVADPLGEDIRMYNADLQLWFVRKDFGSYSAKGFKKIAQLLSGDNSEISIETVQKGLKKQKFGYLVIGDWQELVGNPYETDLQELGKVDGYTVYKYAPPVKYTVTHYADTQGFQCMSYTITTSDGHLIVVDGGRAWQTQTLTDTIIENGGHVDAWIISHPHDDHAGALATILEADWDKSHMTIEKIYVPEISYEKAEEQGLRFDGYSYLKIGLDARDNVTYLKTGDELEVCGLTLKVLHTADDVVYENSTNILNDGSMVFKLIGQEKSMLFLGDIGDNNDSLAAITADVSKGSAMGQYLAEYLLENCSEDLPSDIVQMAHHGSSLLPDTLYEAIHPSYAFFDAPDWLMKNLKKDTDEPSYYTTPHYKKLMKEMGAKIITYNTKKQSVSFY